ncbi:MULTISPECIES: hypothetical protein [Muribaculaceae]|uniref:hypothetical protein n=1 Tax=Muribaculaceae TaxID=2005473 RepID=UPI0010939EFA|nr:MULTISPECIES: hypothetical protein [Muribaculaceae]TGY05928.1 hypothetical protein E5354_02370 [Muribaculum sp. NM65_B17]THG43553.1 hypothetical protein E5985_04710 [Muribaculaceae bacterium]
MATVKLKYRSSCVANKEGSLYYQVIHNRVARQINTLYRIMPHEWDSDNTAIICRSESDERVPINSIL